MSNEFGIFIGHIGVAGDDYMSRIVDNHVLSMRDSLSNALNNSKRLDVSVGYFNIRGWNQISKNLENIYAQMNLINLWDKYKCMIRLKTLMWISVVFVRTTYSIYIKYKFDLISFK